MADNSNAVGTPTEEQLKKINSLSRRELKPEEVYTFSVVLCDNEVDRDFERFTVGALNRLAELYVGKTGIFDHSMHTRDQCARIFECEVISEPGHVTAAGETYHCLKAQAYMTRTESNRDLMLEIDAGIKKEVSVGCATASRTCSICGKDLRTSPCGHRPGRTYTKSGAKQLCHAVLDDPTDAYEWSFVAVPAQRRAGVTKSLSFRDALSSDAVVKRLGELTGATAEDSDEALTQLDSLARRAEEGALYRAEVQKTARRYCLLAQPAMTAEAAERLTESMELDELIRFRDGCKKAAEAALPLSPQLTHGISGEKKDTRNDYRI